MSFTNASAAINRLPRYGADSSPDHQSHSNLEDKPFQHHRRIGNRLHPSKFDSLDEPDTPAAASNSVVVESSSRLSGNEKLYEGETKDSKILVVVGVCEVWSFLLPTLMLWT
jgi:hypothetical protein